MEDFVLTAEELRARRGQKWRKYPPEVLPAFVADMDFKVAPAVQSAFARLVAQQDYVYGVPGDLEALFATLVAYSNPGDGFIVQPPAYPPFLRVVDGTARRLVENPLILRGRF